MRLILGLAGVLLAATPALADYGVRPIFNDFQPAVSTQYRPPDGGKQYFPPDTNDLIRASDRQFDDEDRRARRTPSGQAIPPAGDTRVPPAANSRVGNRPPSEVGR